MKSPQQALYNTVFKLLQGYGYPVITDEEMTQRWSYPFFNIKDTTETMTKHTYESMSGDLTIEIHVWGKKKYKGLHDQVMFQAQMALSQLEQAQMYQLIFKDINTHTTTDTTTLEPLLHSVLQVSYQSL